MRAISLCSRAAAVIAAALVISCSDDDGSTPSGSGGVSGTGGAGGTAGTPGGSGGAAGAAGAATGSVPELGTEATRRFTVIGDASTGLVAPRDLEFAPAHSDQLWVLDEKLNGMVIFFQPGTPSQMHEKRVDFHAGHFMGRPSSLAFGVENRFATCQETRDDWNCGPQAPDDFMGPALWLADLDVYARVGQEPCAPGRPEGSHIDMLHESPLCMGIAHDSANVYFTFDGLNGTIVRYDFVQPHTVGGSYHADGIVRRFWNATVTRVDGIPGHLVLDAASHMLYVADTGAGRVMRLDTTTGVVTGALETHHETVAEYSKIEGATWTELVTGLARPSGIALHADRLFVTDNASGEILAFGLDGKLLAKVATGAKSIMGVVVGPDDKLWFVDHGAQTVVRIDP